MRGLSAFVVAALFLCATATARAQAVYPNPGTTNYTVTDSTGHQVSLIISPKVSGTGIALKSFNGYNANGSTRYIMTFAGTTCPATGTVPVDEITVPTLSDFCSHDHGTVSWYAGGVSICVSTSEGTFTATSTKDAFIHAEVVP